MVNLDRKTIRHTSNDMAHNHIDKDNLLLLNLLSPFLVSSEGRLCALGLFSSNTSTLPPRGLCGSSRGSYTVGSFCEQKPRFTL